VTSQGSHFNPKKRPATVRAAGQSPARPGRNFDQLQASLLHCPRCRRAVPVRERLLLVLPDGQLFEYRCVQCGTSVGERTEKSHKPVKIIL
jgi:hypothetical protein